MPWLGGIGQYIAASGLFVLGWLGPLGMFSVMLGAGVVAGFAWANQFPFYASLGHRAAVGAAGLGAFLVAIVLPFIVHVPPLGALTIFPIHLGLWLGLRRLRALAHADSHAAPLATPGLPA